MMWGSIEPSTIRAAACLAPSCRAAGVNPGNLPNQEATSVICQPLLIDVVSGSNSTKTLTASTQLQLQGTSSSQCKCSLTERAPGCIVDFFHRHRSQLFAASESTHSNWFPESEATTLCESLALCEEAGLVVIIVSATHSSRQETKSAAAKESMCVQGRELKAVQCRELETVHDSDRGSATCQSC